MCLIGFANIMKVPIIFVVHSMGGLVVKKVSTALYRATKTDSPGILARTK